MPKATWNNVLLASARGRVRHVEGKVYWYNPECRPEAKHIEAFVAFWKGVNSE